MEVLINIQDLSEGSDVPFLLHSLQDISTSGFHELALRNPARIDRDKYIERAGSCAGIPPTTVRNK